MGLLDLAERRGAEGDFKEAEKYYKVVETSITLRIMLTAQLLGGTPNQERSSWHPSSPCLALSVFGTPLCHRQQTKTS